MSGCVVRLPCLLLVLVLLTHLASTTILVCPLESQVNTLAEREKLLFRPERSDTTIMLSSDLCNLYKSYFVNSTMYNQLGDNATMYDIRGSQWYEVSFDTEGFFFSMTLMGKNTIKFSHIWIPPPGCNLINGIQISFDSFTVVGKPGINCYLEPIYFRERNFPYGENLSEIFHETYDDDNLNLSRVTFSGGHVIFIPVGAMIFLISICCRCFCRSRKKVQVVRTHAVLRGVVVPIPLPAGPTPPDGDLPPPYSDIQNEVPPPPPYSEIEKQVSSPARAEGIPAESSTSDEAAGEDSNTMKSANTSLSENPRSASSTSLLRMLVSRPKTQFDFKPLKNDE